MPNLSRWRIEQLDGRKWTLLMVMNARTSSESAEDAISRARAMLAGATIPQGQPRAKEYRSGNTGPLIYREAA